MKKIITIISIIVLLVAAAARDAQAQQSQVANIFTLNGVFDDGTQLKGTFTYVPEVLIPFFNITTSGVGSGKGNEIQYCYASSSLGPIPPDLSCPGLQAIGGFGLTHGQSTVSSPPVLSESSVYFLSPYGSVLTIISPDADIFSTLLQFDAHPTPYDLCVAGPDLPSNASCYPNPGPSYGYPWVGGPPGKYLADFLSNEVFLPTYVPGVGYRQAAGRLLVSGTVTGCGARLERPKNGTVKEYLCVNLPPGDQKTTAPK